MSQVSPRPMEAVQVASIDTLLVRGVRSSAMDLPPADLLVFDEAHRARGRTREQLIALYPNAMLLGMTATPCRGDGRGLGNIFDTMIECPQVADLIVGGFLVRSRIYAPVDPDLRGVRTQQGDYVVGQLERRMNADDLVGVGGVAALERLAGRRQPAAGDEVAAGDGGGGGAAHGGGSLEKRGDVAEMQRGLARKSVRTSLNAVRISARNAGRNSH